MTTTFFFLKKQFRFLVIALVLSVVFFALFFVGVDLSLAQEAQPDTFGLQQVDESIAITATDIRVTIARIIRAALGLLGTVAVGLIIYAGFTIMTSGGSPEKVETGKKILRNAVIGLVIILSAFSITQFVLTRLEQATKFAPGQTDNDGTLKGPGGLGFQDYDGTSAQGRVLRDHYPARDQIDIPRNASIVVSFNEPIDPGSMIQNTNQTCFNEQEDNIEAVACDDKNTVPYYGDCVTGAVATGDPAKDCDQMKSTVVQIFKRDDQSQTPVQALGSVVYNNDRLAFDVTFDPTDPALLGDLKNPQWYTVNMTGAVKTVGGDGAFDRYGGKYNWDFQTGVNADFTPPTIKNLYPTSGQNIPRNTTIQITFSEPMHPSVAQGLLKENGSFSHIVFHDAKISGEWKLTNGYTVAEFIPSQQCGFNSCGKALFCLPVTCPAGKNCNSESYSIVARTAALKNKNNNQQFDAVPFSGLQDMAGNALDGNADGNADGQPAVVKKFGVDQKERVADNAAWDFTVQDEVDLTPPYITNVTPALDAANVNQNANVKITFSERMRISSLYDNVKIEEYPQASGVSPLWVQMKSNTVNNQTELLMSHRDFGPNGQDLFYFVSVSSDALSVNGNCFYPGRGPGSTKKGVSPTCSYDANTGKTSGCVDVNIKSGTDTGCVIVGEKSMQKANVEACLTEMKQKSGN